MIAYNDKGRARPVEGARLSVPGRHDKRRRLRPAPDPAQDAHRGQGDDGDRLEPRSREGPAVERILTAGRGWPGRVGVPGLALVLAIALAGCGVGFGAGEEEGTADLAVTRDYGSRGAARRKRSGR